MNKVSYHIYLLLLSFFMPISIFGQQTTYLIGNKVINVNDLVNSENFDPTVIEEIIFDKINIVLEKRGFESFNKNEILKEIAKDQAMYMVDIDDDVYIRNSKEKETTISRLQYYGCSKHGDEIVGKTNIKKGKFPYSYGQVADNFVLQLFSSSKKSALLATNKYNLIGIGAELSASKKKIYLSIMVGNFKTLNTGVTYKDQLKVPYSTKNYGITEPDPIFCKKVNRKENLSTIQNGLYVEDDIIYLELENIKPLKKIIRKKKDGLAVDILQKDQFTCSNENIFDYNLINQGVLTKRVYSNKLYKNNIANTKENKYAFKSALGYLPEGLRDNIELNLVIIQNKSYCRTLTPSYITNTEGKYKQNVELLADTVTINSNFSYKPVADSMLLSFKIPFGNKKVNYKTEDIEPFLKLLNEPAFIILDINIRAYSSIEGTDKENKFLQEERAKSIIKALRERQRESIATDIQTAYNWNDFKVDIRSTKHNILASMSMEEAQQYIRDYNLRKELEPILSKHRYAEINMKVTYDISGKNEQPYVIKKFKNAVLDEDRPLALSIQKFIINQIENKRYHISALEEMEIPTIQSFAGMEMNRIYMLWKYDRITEEDFVKQVASLNEIDPGNEYIAFNNLLNTINTSTFNDLSTNNITIQNNIERLYYTPLRKSTVDGLNVKYQFALINGLDSVSGDNNLRTECINRIKEIVDIKEESLSNSLKLAEIFIENGDYTFARKSLEPWVENTSNEKVLFTYASLCSQNEWLMHTNKFTKAMTQISNINKDGFCELFKGDKFSYKVLENNKIKELYCKSCNQTGNVVEVE